MPETETATETVATATETVVKEDEKFDASRAMALIEKLRQENRELGKAAKRAGELEAAETKRKEAEMTDLQKAQAQLKELDAQLKAEKSARLRNEAAQKVGLPMELAKRLQGETPEELEADAKTILAALPQTTKTTPKVNPTNPGGASTTETEEQKRARLLGPSTLTLDPEFIKAKGGGVFYSEG